MRYFVIFLVLIVFSSSISLSFSETQHTTEITSFLCGGLALEGIPNSLEEQEWVKTTLEKCVELGLVTQENIETIRSSGVHTTREVYGLFRATNGDIDKISQLVTHPNYPINVFGSPYQQVSIGTEPENILCRENLVLVFKYDHSPACVTESTKQKLIERGWGATSDDLTLTSEHTCGKFYPAPKRQHADNTVPVLLMDMDSTACARLTFTIYHDDTYQYWSPIANFTSSIFIGNYNYQKEGITFSRSAGQDYTNSFHIDTVPQTVDITNLPIGSNFTITYIIQPLSNATGFYDQSIPELACERYPLAVGYTADHVDYTDFSHISMLYNTCVAGTYVLDAVEISGMTYKELEIPPNLTN